MQLQKKAPVRVIIGNPPYSIGQKSANDNAQNQEYTKLDSRIIYVFKAKILQKNSKALYDAYIKAFRWSTDRLDPKNGGVIAFVSNGAWLDGNSTDGFRKAIEKEFSSIWVFNHVVMPGHKENKGERKRVTFLVVVYELISITLLVKNPDSKADKATIRYHNIGDYLNREKKVSHSEEIQVGWQ